MNGLIKIENQELQVKEFNGQRVVTFKDIAKVHEVDFENVKRNFTNNKHHFIEGQDYYSISRNEFRENFSPNEKLIGNPMQVSHSRIEQFENCKFKYKLNRTCTDLS